MYNVLFYLFFSRFLKFSGFGLKYTSVIYTMYMHHTVDKYVWLWYAVFFCALLFTGQRIIIVSLSLDQLISHMQ